MKMSLAEWVFAHCWLQAIKYAGRRYVVETELENRINIWKAQDLVKISNGCFSCCCFPQYTQVLLY